MPIESIKPAPARRTIAMGTWCILVLAGCSDSALDRQPVLGRVTFLGDPVVGATVLFQNKDNGEFCACETDRSGCYRVTSAGGDGLPVGQFQASVTPPTLKLETGKPPPTLPPADIVPQRYQDPKTSGLELRVKPGENRYDIDMQP